MEVALTHTTHTHAHTHGHVYYHINVLYMYTTCKVALHRSISEYNKLRFSETRTYYASKKLPHTA